MSWMEWISQRTDEDVANDTEIYKNLYSFGDDEEDDADKGDAPRQPRSPADGLKALQDLTGKLLDELKKTSRFGISAAAIQSSNAVLKVVRFLRFTK